MCPWRGHRRPQPRQEHWSRPSWLEHSGRWDSGRGTIVRTEVELGFYAAGAWWVVGRGGLQQQRVLWTSQSLLSSSFVTTRSYLPLIHLSALLRFEQASPCSVFCAMPIPGPTPCTELDIYCRYIHPAKAHLWTRNHQVPGEF